MTNSTVADDSNHTISGSVEKVTFRSDENGFSVLQIKAANVPELVTITGITHSIEVGEYVECTGEWIVDKRFGKQLKASLICPGQPKTLEGIEKYLSSGLIKGVGPKLAKKLIKKFGEDLFDVIDSEPERLMDVSGFSEKRMEEVAESWARQKETNAVMIFLSANGVGVAQALKIGKLYGGDSIRLITNDPYRLAIEIDGFGFQKSDEIAQRLGVTRNSLGRARAGVRHVMKELSSKGHCACEIQNLINRTNKLLDMEPDLLREAISIEVKHNSLVEEIVDARTLVYLSPLWKAEDGVARNLLRLSRGSNRMRHAGAISPSTLRETLSDMNLSPSQAKAVELSIEQKVLIITGGPGVGKTTLVKALIEIAKKREQSNIVLCAPTGRAAKKLAESTGQEAKTIHRLLEFEHQHGGFKRNSENPIDADTLVIDEASMIDIKLMDNLLEAVPSTANVFIVGDIDQLPSVGPGTVLSDLIKSDTIPVVRLSEVFRQAKASKIIVNAHKINKGQMPTVDARSDGPSDYYFIKTSSNQKTLELIVKLVSKRIPKEFGFDAVQDIQVLSPMNKGELGSRILNIELQKELNPPQENSVHKMGFSYSFGDKVIQMVNDYDKGVFNGDVGTITDVDLEETELSIDFDGRVVKYSFSELDSISLAYATSIHKSQGSEYPAVVIPISSDHSHMLERNLLYTAVTRAKKVVVLVGQIEALELAIRKRQSNRRVTGLANRLSNY